MLKIFDALFTRAAHVIVLFMSTMEGGDAVRVRFTEQTALVKILINAA